MADDIFWESTVLQPGPVTYHTKFVLYAGGGGGGAVIIQEVTVVAVTVVAINGILLLISDFSFLNSQAIYHHTF